MSALLELARSGRTSDPYFKKIARAQKTNRLLGGAFFAPWELDQLDEDWLTAFCALEDELPGMRAVVSRQDSTRSKWLEKVGYREYLKVPR